MSFPTPNQNYIQEKLARLTPETTATWGAMHPQRMVEHLSESVQLAYTEHNFPLTVPADKIERVQAFIASEHPMPKNFQVAFATPDTPLRLESIEAATAELLQSWQAYELWWEANPDATKLHPSFGDLNRTQWARVHAKHFAHHFEQFGL